MITYEHTWKNLQVIYRRGERGVTIVKITRHNGAVVQLSVGDIEEAQNDIESFWKEMKPCN